MSFDDSYNFFFFCVFDHLSFLFFFILTAVPHRRILACIQPTYTQTASPNLKRKNNETTSSPRTTSHDASPTRRRRQSTAIPADASRFCISDLQNSRPALRNSPRPASSAPDRARIRCATTAAAETQRPVPAYLRCVALRCVKLKNFVRLRLAHQMLLCFYWCFHLISRYLCNLPSPICMRRCTSFSSVMVAPPPIDSCLFD